jgi:HSP20 family protein
MFYVSTPRYLRALRAFDAAFPAEDVARSPALDVAEDEASYTVTLDMPGVNKADVKVKVEGRSVQIDASPAASDAAESRVLHRERRALRYARNFSLPQELNQEASQAQFENGVLTLKLVKRELASGLLTIN